MSKLLDTQILRLHGIVRAARFRVEQFNFENDDTPCIEWVANAHVGRFTYEGDGNRVLKFTPGSAAIEDTELVNSGDFEESLRYVHRWLEYLRRELLASGARGSNEVLPSWLESELPARYVELSEEIAQRESERHRLLSHGRLLWQTGDDLSEAVRDVFREFGYGAELTSPGATYDVTVIVGPGKRLLIEVTGIEGAIAKASRKISQLLQACQEAVEGDRVVLAANVYRSKPPVERRQLEPITRDALQLVGRLGANVLTTQTLYAIWYSSLANASVATAAVEALYAAEGETFTWTGPTAA
jgi:hypothetical protein